MTIMPVAIEDTSPKDLLNRQAFVDQLIDVADTLAKCRKNSCYAITGSWGSGKSFVLDMFETQASKIGLEGTTLDKYLIFRYNCWEYDYYEEPLVAIVASMLDQINEKTNLLPKDSKARLIGVFKEVGKCFLTTAASAIKVKTGVDACSLLDMAENGVSAAKTEVVDMHEYDHYFEFKKNLEKLRKEIKKLSEGQTIVFIVDELDRCLPEYTIKVLERLHHLFNEIPNVQMVLSIDIDQLEHTVMQIYGEKTDVKMYLQKLIGFEIKLDLGTINDSFYGRFEDYFKSFVIKQDITDIQEVNWFFSLIMEGLDMRSRFAIIERCDLLHTLAYKEERADYCYMCLELLLVILRNNTPIDIRFAKEQFGITRVFEAGRITPSSTYIPPQGLKKLSEMFSKNKAPNRHGLLFEEDRNGSEVYTRVENRSLLGRLLCAYRVILGFTEDHYYLEESDSTSFYDSIKTFTDYGRKLWNLMEIIR